MELHCSGVINLEAIFKSFRDNLLWKCTAYEIHGCHFQLLQLMCIAGLRLLPAGMTVWC